MLVTNGIPFYWQGILVVSQQCPRQGATGMVSANRHMTQHRFWKRKKPIASGIHSNWPCGTGDESGGVGKACRSYEETELWMMTQRTVAKNSSLYSLVERVPDLKNAPRTVQLEKSTAICQSVVNAVLNGIHLCQTMLSFQTMLLCILKPKPSMVRLRKLKRY